MTNEAIIDIEQAVKVTLQALGVDITDENFKETPSRVAKAYGEIVEYQNDIVRGAYIEDIFKTSFPTNYSGIVAQKSIKTISMCPHHMQPISYEIDIGYVANKRALGLSKIARVSKALSKRMVLQETLTDEICATFFNKLKTKGVIVVVRGKHGCMANRGIGQDIVTTTSSIRGIFEEDIALRQEFLALNH